MSKAENLKRPLEASDVFDAKDELERAELEALADRITREVA